MQTIHESLNPLGRPTSQAKLVGLLKKPDANAKQDSLPAMVIVPGGSYTHIPVAQAETLALAFSGRGYQSFYLRYSFVDERTPLMPDPVAELGAAVTLIRQNAEEWHVDPQRIVIAGFSVGGQIVALYNDWWHTEKFATALKQPVEQLKPNAVVLGYPVISPEHGFPTDEQMLAQWTDTPNEIAADQQVNAFNQPTFIWVTADDQLVPSQNALHYATALAAQKIPYELHVFQHGPHGLALANEQTAWKPDANQPHVAHWLTLATEWLDTTLTDK